MANSIFITFCSIIVILIILTKYSQYKAILIIAFLIRIFIMMADLNHWFPILHSGLDSENFHNIAFSNNHYPGEQVYLTSYSVFLTFLYSLTNCSRPIAQFLNVLFGMGVLFTLIKSCRYLNIDRKRIRICLIILAFLPHMIIFSAILLREAWIQFFVALSFLTFIKWYKEGSVGYFLKSIGFVLIAAIMHAGVLPLLVVYIFAGIIYQPTQMRFRLSSSRLIGIGIILGIGIIFLGPYLNIFTEKFETLSDKNLTDIMAVSSRAESAYLLWLPSSSNLLLQFLFTILRVIYFFISPVPLDWRGLGDVFAFCMDASVYIFLFFIIYKRYAKPIYKHLKHFIVLAVLFSSALFAVGTNAAGTAMRHRSKFLEPLCLAYCLSIYKSRPMGIKSDPTNNRGI